MYSIQEWINEELDVLKVYEQAIVHLSFVTSICLPLIRHYDLVSQN